MPTPAVLAIGKLAPRPPRIDPLAAAASPGLRGRFRRRCRVRPGGPVSFPAGPFPRLLGLARPRTGRPIADEQQEPIFLSLLQEPIDVATISCCMVCVSRRVLLSEVALDRSLPAENSNGFSCSAVPAWPSSSCTPRRAFRLGRRNHSDDQVCRAGLVPGPSRKLRRLGGRERPGGAGRVVELPGAKIDFLLEEFSSFNSSAARTPPGAS